MDPSIIRQRLLRDQIVNNPTTQDARTPLTELVQAAGIRDLASRVRANEERTSDATRVSLDYNNNMYTLSGFNMYGSIARNPPQHPNVHPTHRQCMPVKPSPEIELLKIDDMDNYVEACAKYNQGMKEGWTKEQLFDMIAEIRNRPSHSEGEDQLLV